MKRTLAFGLAAMMAASTFAVTAVDAKPKGQGWKGGNWNQNYNHKKRYKKKYNNNNYNPVAPFLFGSIVGLAVGSAFAAPPPAYPYPYPAYDPGYYGGSPHVQWCLSHYRTYNPATNTYYIKVGVPAVCISPYTY